MLVQAILLSKRPGGIPFFFCNRTCDTLRVDTSNGEVGSPTIGRTLQMTSEMGALDASFVPKGDRTGQFGSRCFKGPCRHLFILFDHCHGVWDRYMNDLRTIVSLVRRVSRPVRRDGPRRRRAARLTREEKQRRLRGNFALLSPSDRRGRIGRWVRLHVPHGTRLAPGYPYIGVQMAHSPSKDARMLSDTLEARVLLKAN